jgi:hypothetical protein
MAKKYSRLSNYHLSDFYNYLNEKINHSSNFSQNYFDFSIASCKFTKVFLSKTTPNLLGNTFPVY